MLAKPDSIEAARRQKYNENLLRRQAFKYERMPNSEQQRAMSRFAGSCRFVFIEFGHIAHADVVGAINVLERGQRLFACGEDGSGRSRKTTTQPASAKQEPTEATMLEASLA